MTRCLLPHSDTYVFFRKWKVGLKWGLLFSWGAFFFFLSRFLSVLLPPVWAGWLFLSQWINEIWFICVKQKKNKNKWGLLIGFTSLVSFLSFFVGRLACLFIVLFILRHWNKESNCFLRKKKNLGWRCILLSLQLTLDLHPKKKKKSWPPRFFLGWFLGRPILFKAKWEKLKMLLTIRELIQY
jgi:hypothetical protein